MAVKFTEAWVKIGYWLGGMHRLGAPLKVHAPVDLPYGNYAGEKLVAHYLAHARRGTTAHYRAEVEEAAGLLDQAEAFLQPRRPNLRRGVVHGDPHFWNVLYIQHEPIAMIDLDCLQQGYLIADVAYASIWLTFWQRTRRRMARHSGPLSGRLRRRPPRTAQPDGKAEPSLDGRSLRRVLLSQNYLHRRPE